MLWVYAGFQKISVNAQVELYSRVLEVWGWLSPSLLGKVIPWVGWLEVVLGVGFLPYFSRKLAALGSLVCVVFFAAFHWTAWVRGDARSCGCWSDVRDLSPEELGWHFFFSLAVLFFLAACAIVVLLGGRFFRER